MVHKTIKSSRTDFRGRRRCTCSVERRKLLSSDSIESREVWIAQRHVLWRFEEVPQVVVLEENDGKRKSTIGLCLPYSAGDSFRCGYDCMVSWIAWDIFNVFRRKRCGPHKNCWCFRKMWWFKTRPKAVQVRHRRTAEGTVFEFANLKFYAQHNKTLYCLQDVFGVIQPHICVSLVSLDQCY